MPLKILFINAHPDDVEFTCASTKKQAVDLGWDAYEMLMTSDEYGCKQNDFKGKRIRKIRMHEMSEAAKIYGENSDGSPKINLIWFGEIDGYLPFNRNVFLKVRNKILEIKPDVVIGPDSFFSMDLHPDHKHTGWLVYLAVKSINPPERPALLLYHSFNTNFYIRINEMKIQIEAWAMHKSQNTPLGNKVLWQLRKVFYTLRRRKTGPLLAEGFRKCSFEKGENNIKNTGHRIVYHCVYRLFAGMKARWLPTPKELGLI